MKISVIVPVYGVEPYVRDCLASVGSQKFDGEIECLVVDDRGPDRSMDVVRDFIAAYDGPVDFRIITRPDNGGLSAARNSGLDAATGSHVYFLDSDDELLPDALASISAPLAAHPDLDLIVSPYLHTATQRSLPRLDVTPYRLLTSDELRSSYMRGEWFMMAPSKLYSSVLLRREQLRFMPGIIHEDDLWSFQVALRARSMVVTDKPTYFYNLREDSITGKVDHRRRADAFSRIFGCLCRDVYVHGLSKDADVHKRMQRYFRAALYEAVSVADRRYFVDRYMAMRQAPMRWRDTLSVYGLAPRQLMNNLHWILPVPVAAVFLWQQLKSKSWSRQ